MFSALFQYRDRLRSLLLRHALCTVQSVYDESPESDPAAARGRGAPVAEVLAVSAVLFSTCEYIRGQGRPASNN